MGLYSAGIIIGRMFASERDFTAVTIVIVGIIVLKFGWQVKNERHQKAAKLKGRASARILVNYSHHVGFAQS